MEDPTPERHQYDRLVEGTFELTITSLERKSAEFIFVPMAPSAASQGLEELEKLPGSTIVNKTVKFQATF